MNILKTHKKFTKRFEPVLEYTNYINARILLNMIKQHKIVVLFDIYKKLKKRVNGK